MHRLREMDFDDFANLELSFRELLYKNSGAAYHSERENLPIRSFLAANSQNFTAFGSRDESGALATAFALCFSDELPVAYLSYWSCINKNEQAIMQIFLKAKAEVLARGFKSMQIWVLASQEGLLRTLGAQDLWKSDLFSTMEELPAGTRSFFHGYWNYLQMNLVASEPSRMVELRV